MAKKNNGKWYRRKTYPHFDKPLAFEEALKCVQLPDQVKRHSFFPFLSFVIEQRRFGKKEAKKRGIKYASHRDGYIFSFYAEMLSYQYEQLLADKDLSEVVLAYRSGKGSNIDFAKEAFDQIERLAPCIAIGIDVSSFFDSIDHLLLKEQWARLLGVVSLPEDHYAVFRALTKYSHVDRDECYKRLGYSSRKRAKTRPICGVRQFRELVKGRGTQMASLIQTNTKSFGIPQGSSMSALLSNIYMLPFDEEMTELARKTGGLYRRYCDDILWICPIMEETAIVDAVLKAIADRGSAMQIQEAKTTRSHFLKQPDGSLALQTKDKPFQYLGFTFDGKRRLMRSQTISRFWRKVVNAVKNGKKDYTRTALTGKTSKVFRRKLYRQYSHLGNRNFLSYAKRSAKIMATSSPWKKHSTWRQVKNHWNRLHQELDK